MTLASLERIGCVDSDMGEGGETRRLVFECLLQAMQVGAIWADDYKLGRSSGCVEWQGCHRYKVSQEHVPPCLPRLQELLLRI
jgi:hypothetical protein